MSRTFGRSGRTLNAGRKKILLALLVISVLGAGILGYNLVSGRDDGEWKMPSSFCWGLIPSGELEGISKAHFVQETLAAPEPPATLKELSTYDTSCLIEAETWPRLSMAFKITRMPSNIADYPGRLFPELDPQPQRYPDGAPGWLGRIEYGYGRHMYLRIPECATQIPPVEPTYPEEKFSWYVTSYARNANIDAVEARKLTDPTIHFRDNLLRRLGCDPARPGI